MRTGKCPKCGREVDFEPIKLLPGIVPICDECEASQTSTWAIQETARKWRQLYFARIPPTYGRAVPAMVSQAFASVLSWTGEDRFGGLGLIGVSGAGKSSAIACRLFTLEKPFRWWSGTEARDAAIDAATADKDREGARQRWEAAMRTPILVLDDISQGKMTDAWSSKLFDLLETRLSGRLPTFWTSQISLEEFRAKIVRQNGQDAAQADAISRRLAQHSLVLKS